MSFQPSQFTSQPSSHIVAGQEQQGQRLVVQQNQPPPNNFQIQHLHEQIQKQKMQQAPPGVIMPKPSSPNQLLPPPNPFQPQPVLQPPPPHIQSQFPAQPLNYPPPGMVPSHPPPTFSQPVSQNFFPSNAPPIKPSSPSHPLMEKSPS